MAVFPPAAAVAPASTKADPLIFSMLRDCAAFPILQVGAMAVDGAWGITLFSGSILRVCFLGEIRAEAAVFFRSRRNPAAGG